MKFPGPTRQTATVASTLALGPLHLSYPTHIPLIRECSMPYYPERWRHPSLPAACRDGHALQYACPMNLPKSITSPNTKFFERQICSLLLFSNLFRPLSCMMVQLVNAAF